MIFWHMFAHSCKAKDGSTEYYHVGRNRRWVELFNMRYPTVDVKVSVDPNGKYWGWLASGSSDPSMIWNNRTLFSACFATSPESEERGGKGRVLQLNVESFSLCPKCKRVVFGHIGTMNRCECGALLERDEAGWLVK